MVSQLATREEMLVGLRLLLGNMESNGFVVASVSWVNAWVGGAW